MQFPKPFKDLILLVTRLFLHGPTFALESNKAIFDFLLDQVCKTWSSRIVEMDLDWKNILHCCYFNNLTLQSVGNAALLKHTDSSSIIEALSVLASLHQVEMLEFLFDASSKFKVQSRKFHVLPHSALSIVEHFSAFGKIYFPFSGNDAKIGFNLWLNLYLFCISALEGLKLWRSETSVDLLLIKAGVKKCFAEMRTFLEHRYVVKTFLKKDTVVPLFRDWAKENVEAAKQWLISESVELNFIASAFLIEMFKVLKDDESIELPDLWRDSLKLDCLSIINQSQRDAIEVFLEVRKRKSENFTDPLAKRSATSPSSHDRAPRNYGVSAELLPPFVSDAVSASRFFPLSHSKPNVPANNFTARPATGIKKPSSSSKSSVLQKLKPALTSNAHIYNSNSQPNKTVKNLGAILGDNEDGPDSPKEARKIKQISIPEIRKMGIAIRDPSIPKSNSKKAPLVKMKKLFDLVLSWNENAVRSNSTIGIPVAVPDTFADGYNYVRTFEPLFFMECRESFRNAYLEYKKNSSYKLILSELKKVDNNHQIALLMSWEHYKLENWGENSVLILTSNDISVVALLRKVRNRKAEVVLYCDIKIKPSDAHNFRNESEWLVLYLLSMTTQIREYQALSLG